MPFYQMLCIAAHYADYAHIKGLVTLAAKHVMDNGGVVRQIESWGTRSLPQRMKKQNVGDYWTMNFDASPHTLRSLNNLMRGDARVIRTTTLKVGERVEDIIDTKMKTLRTQQETSRM